MLQGEIIDYMNTQKDADQPFIIQRIILMSQHCYQLQSFAMKLLSNCVFMGEDSIRGLKQATITANLASSVGFDQKFLNQTCFRYLASTANSDLQDSEPLDNI